MNVSFIEQPVRAFDIWPAIRAAAKPTEGERATIDKSLAEIRRLLALQAATAAPRGEGYTFLEAQAAAAGEKLAAEPSLETAERYHAALARLDAAAATAGKIHASLNVALRRAIDTLAPVAVRIISEAEAAFMKEAESVTRALDKAVSFGQETPAEFAQRLDAAKAEFANLRQWVTAEGAALAFLAEKVAACKSPFGETLDVEQVAALV
jgi:hypothetical protein